MRRPMTSKWDNMTEEEWDVSWYGLTKGINFEDHQESYNFHMNFPECLICGEPITHWIPAKDGWLMPACDKHSKLKITDRRWAKARAIRQQNAEETADLRCHKCGKKPVVAWIGKEEAPECYECNLAD